MEKPRCIMSVDVEDWYHILDLPATPPMSEWASLPVRVERNFGRLLDHFDAASVRTTCFFLGWIAERFPGLVRAAVDRGHEIASHGYGHELVYQQGERAFFEDVSRARGLIEDIAGCGVTGYRSPGFSTTRDTPWFFERLAEAGYRYDSSVFPASRGHGGFKEAASVAPHAVDTPRGPIVEFPVSVATLWSKRMCFFGGGYLRLFPYSLIRRKAREVLAEGRPVVFYVHPRDIDPGQPRLPMNARRRFKSYVGLGSAETKVRRLLDDFEFITFEEYLASRNPGGS